MRSNRLWRWVAATVVVGLAALGYVLWIPVRHVNPAKVASLAVTGSLPGIAGSPHGTQGDPSTSQLAAVRRAAASTPAETAQYTVTWGGGTAGTKTPSAMLMVLALPRTTDARAARVDARRSYAGRTSFIAQGVGYAGPLHLRSVPEATAATYTAGTSPTITPTTRRVDAAVFSVGRVVVVATTQGTQSQAKVALDALAAAEYRHLGRLLPAGAAPGLGETSFPLVASLVYVAVAAVVLAAVQFAPWAMAAARRRREAAWEAALRRERASRGSKVVRRRAGRTPVGRPRAGRAGRSVRSGRPRAGGARARR